MRIAEHLRRNIHVGHLFFIVVPRDSALAALAGLAQIMPFMNGHSSLGKGIQIHVLPLPVWSVMSVIADARGEKMHCREDLPWFQESCCQGVKVQPIVFTLAAGFEPEIEVETVNVGDNTHYWPSPMFSGLLTLYAR